MNSNSLGAFDYAKDSGNEEVKWKSPFRLGLEYSVPSGWELF